MFEIAEIIPWDDLREQVRGVPLLHDRDGQQVFPYRDAEITLESVSYTATRTMSLYVSRQLLELQAGIAAAIAPHGYDPLQLESGLVLSSSDDEGKPMLTGFIPPIVEVTKAYGAYLLDGSHRANQGRWLGRTAFTAIVIHGIREDCPAYAYPNDWDEVRMYEEVPREPLLRKRYRPDMYAYFRDFGPLNGSRPRYGE